MNLNLLLIVILLIFTLIYTYKNDFGIFLFIILIISVLFYMYGEIEKKIETITNPIKNLENIYKNSIGKIL